jgi:hypothetical protein
MKVGLLVPGNLSYGPFVQIYVNILQENYVEYDILNWDKNGINENVKYQFKHLINDRTSKIRKFFEYVLFSFFLIKIIRKKKYKKLIVFTPQLGILLTGFLKRYYFKSFIFDYRDYSDTLIFQKRFELLLSISALNCISSSGYISYLPPKNNYILSHNFDINMMRKYDNYSTELNKNNPIIILYIGIIRDYDRIIELITALANNKKYKLMFVGKSSVGNKIRDFISKNNIFNVEIFGSYKKEDEFKFIKQATFINIYLSHILTYDKAMANRFYSALLYCKPMIVTKNTTQDYYVKKYKLGIGVDNMKRIEEEISNYLNNFDQSEYMKCRKVLIEKFLNDYSVFEEEVLSVLRNA